MILPALIAKFLSAGAIAQAATGATVAVVAFTGVGAVGALPGPVQDTFATVVAEITPLEPPTSEEPTEATTEESTEESTEEVVSEEVVVEDVESTVEAPAVPTDAEVLAAEVKAWALTGPVGDESISEWISKGSSAEMKGWLRAHGMTFGNVVSAHASGKGFTEEELAVLGADVQPVDAPTEPVSDEGTDEVSETDDTEVAATTEDSGSRGNGKGNGNGGGGNGGGGNGRGNAKN